MLFSSEQAFQSLQELNVASIGCAEMPSFLKNSTGIKAEIRLVVCPC
jgi:hypothetical protein